MTTDFGVVLDACVLIPMPLADTSLRLAEHPRLFLPRWSDAIMTEVARNMVEKLNKTPAQAAHREAEIRKAFPEAWVSGYEPLVDVMSNHPKDRHVLAAAVVSKSEVIVTYNRKDFPGEALKPWGIKLRGPSRFLRDLYDLNPAIVTHKIIEQAQNVGLPLKALLSRLNVNVPGFVDFFCREIGVELSVAAPAAPIASLSGTGFGIPPAETIKHAQKDRAAALRDVRRRQRSGPMA